jgi:ketosteroid isomerase-like protein
MSENKTILQFFEMFNDHDVEGMGQLLVSEAEFYFPKTQPLIGKERILRFFNILFRQYPQLSFEIQRIIRQGSQAAVHWTNRGVSRKKESYQNEGVTILEMTADKISFISDFFKNTEKF